MIHSSEGIVGAAGGWFMADTITMSAIFADCLKDTKGSNIR